MVTVSRMAMYRQWQFSQIRQFIPIARHIIHDLSEDKRHTLRDGGTGWTVVEVICHLRDFDRVFMERAEKTLRDEYAELSFPDANRIARERNYNVLSGEMAIMQWEASRRDMLKVFENIGEDDETWERIGAHPKRGPFSLNDQLMLVTWHDALHLEQIVKIIRDQ